MNNTTFSSEELEELKQECNNILQNIEAIILKITLTNNLQVIDQLFRSFHNLKGMAGFMSWTKMQTISANCESVLEFHRKNESFLTKLSINLIKQGVELLKYCLDNNDQVTVDNMDFFGNQVETHLNEQIINKNVSSNKSSDLVDSDIDYIIETNQNKLIKIEKLINSIESELNKLELIKINSNDLNKIKNVFIAISDLLDEDDNQDLVKISNILDDFFSTFSNNTQLFPKEYIKRAINCIDILIAFLFVEEKKLPIDVFDKYILEIDSFSDDVSNLISKKQTEIFQQIESMTSFTFRIDIDFMLKLMNEVEELFISVKKSYKSNSLLVSDIKEIYESTLTVQKMMHKATRIPLKQLFFRFGRVVKNAGTLINKEIQFFMTGEKIEIDRSYLEPLNVSIIHLLRNSCDHGIESKEERIKLGKSEVAKIEINPIVKDNKLIIEIKDDGRGLDRTKISNKLISLKWYTPEQIKVLSDKEIYSHIFKPGFSTTSAVTDISGRGVGMDIVNREIGKLNGIIEIESKKNIGLIIKIILPYNLMG